MKLKITGLMLIAFVIACFATFAQDPANTVYTTVETTATYPGGPENFQHYIDANKRDPLVNGPSKMTGKVYVSFIVEKDGTVTDIRITKGFGHGCDEEAFRLMKNSVKWTPARNKGIVVRQQCNTVISFGPSPAERFAGFPEVRIDEPVPTSNEKMVVTNEIYTSVEHSAEYPGGIEAFYNFIGKNLKYPATARQNDVTGKVILTFVVEKDGRLTDLRVLRGIGSGCDEEAVRVVKSSEKWLPGKMNNQLVRQQYTVPVTFGGTPQSSSPITRPLINTGLSQGPPPTVDNRNLIRTIAEEQAVFQGGAQAFDDYLTKNLKYPAAARAAHIQGKVFVTFVVERDGSLTDIKVLRGVRADIDAEALRLIKSAGKWMPGKFRNSAIRQQITLPVSFDL